MYVTPPPVEMAEGPQGGGALEGGFREGRGGGVWVGQFGVVLGGGGTGSRSLG